MATKTKTTRNSALHPPPAAMRPSRHEEVLEAASLLLSAVRYHGGALTKQETAAMGLLDRALQKPWADDRYIWCGSRLTSAAMRRLHEKIARLDEELTRARRPASHHPKAQK